MTRNDPPKGAVRCGGLEPVSPYPMYDHVQSDLMRCDWTKSRRGERYTNGGDATDLSRRLSADICGEDAAFLTPVHAFFSTGRLGMTQGEWFGNPYARASRKEGTE